jgi:HSP20 family protein
MRLARWYKPQVTNYGRLSDLRQEFDALESPLATLARTSQWLTGWNPALDVHDDKNNYVVQVELPGMKKDEIEVALHDGVLTISGERKADTRKDAQLYRSERYVGRFERSLTLPGAVNTDKISAQYKDGVLTITLPKAEEAKPKQIDINIH